MNPEWQARVEFKLENHDKDLVGIADSLTSINDQIQMTNQILQTFALADERFNSRMESMQTMCTARIEKAEEHSKHLMARIDKVETTIAKVAWTVVMFVIIGVIASGIKFT